MIKQLNKGERPYVCKRNSRLFNLGGVSCFNQHNAAQWIWVPFRLQT